MVKEEDANNKSVIKVHTTILVLSLAGPVLLYLLKFISAKQCISLMGVGFFILSGHACAYYNKYFEYLKAQDVTEFLDEKAIKKMLTISIAVDLIIAIFLYTLGAN